MLSRKINDVLSDGRWGEIQFQLLLSLVDNNSGSFTEGPHPERR